MDYNLLINGVYWGYNPPTNHLLTSWDIQAGANFQFQEILNTSAMGSDFVFCNGHIWCLFKIVVIKKEHFGNIKGQRVTTGGASLPMEVK